MRRSLAAALLVALGATVFAQSLAEIAEREKAKKKDPKAKTYTEEDLAKGRQANPSPSPKPRGRTTPPPSMPNEPIPEGGAETPPPPLEPGDPTAVDTAPLPATEAGWRLRAGQKREAVKAAEKKVATLQAQLDGLALDANPPADELFNPNRLQGLEARKAKLREDLDAARASLEQARQSLAQLEDDARRAGVPPGWLRE